MASASDAGRSAVLVSLAQATSGQSETVTYQTPSKEAGYVSAAVVLGMKLEYQHWRISSAFEELKPLSMQPRSRLDLVYDTFEQEM